jgi:hypothetical protein
MKVTCTFADQFHNRRVTELMGTQIDHSECYIVQAILSF